MKRLGPKDPDMTWEMALGTYWLPRLGAAAVSVAVVFLLTLALQRWGPLFRVALGYSVSATLLLGGWRLDRKYPAYARVLFGAGIALTYFVTFSTYFVPFAKLFDSPVPTLIGLGAIVAAWVALAVGRRSPIIAGIAVLLGHLTIGLTTFTLDDPALVSVLGIVVLSLGSAFFLLRMRWYYIAALGMIAAYTNHYLIMSRTETTGTVAEFSLGMAVLGVYLLIFALAELFAPERIRRAAVPAWFRNGFVAANTLCFFALGTLLVDGYAFAEDSQHIFRYALAIALLSIGIAYLRIRAGDPLYNTYLTKGVTIATFGLAAQFSAHTLTTWLAVEMLVLLVSARQSGLVVTRILALLVAIVAFAHAVVTLTLGDPVAYASDDYIARLFQAGITVFAYLAASRFYQWVDWSSRAPRTLPFSDATRLQLWKLDLIAERPGASSGEDKPLGGLLFPYLFAMAGVALVVYGYVGLLAESGDRGVVAALAALALAGLAVALKSAPFGRGAVVLAATALVPWWLRDVWAQDQIAYSDPLYFAVAAKAGLTLLVFFGLSEWVRRIATHRDEVRRGVFPSLGWVDLRTFALTGRADERRPSEDQEHILPHLLAIGALAVFTGWSFPLIDEGHRFLAFAVLALASGLIAVPLRALPFGLVSAAAVALVAVFGTVEMLDSVEKAVVVPGLVLLGLCGLLTETRYVGERAGLRLHQHRFAPYPLYGLLAWLLGLYFVQNFQPTNEVFALLISAIVAAGLVLVLHRRALVFCSVALLLWAQLQWYIGWTEDATTAFLALAWAVMAAAVLSDRYYAYIRVTFLWPVLVAAAWALLFPYIYLEAPRDWVSLYWALGAAAFLAYAAVFRRRTPALLGLLGAVIASLHQAYYAYDVDMDLAPLLAGFLAPTFLFIAFDRAAAFVGSRVDLKLPFQPAAGFIAAASALLVIMLERIPALAEFYLTISWTVLGVVLFALALTFHEKMYRYAGLTVLLLASLRVLLVDTRELETLPKVGAWGVLGAVLIALGYGYVLAFARTRTEHDNPPSHPEKND